MGKKDERRKAWGRKQIGSFITLDRRRRLLYTLDSFEIMMVKSGMQTKDFLNMDKSHIPLVVWAGLIWEDPGLTIKEVERMIQDKTQGNKIRLAEMALGVLSVASISLEKDKKFRHEFFRGRGE